MSVGEVRAESDVRIGVFVDEFGLPVRWELCEAVGIGVVGNVAKFNFEGQWMIADGSVVLMGWLLVTAGEQDDHMDDFGWNASIGEGAGVYVAVFDGVVQQGCGDRVVVGVVDVARDSVDVAKVGITGFIDLAVVGLFGNAANSKWESLMPSLFRD